MDIFVNQSRRLWSLKAVFLYVIVCVFVFLKAYPIFDVNEVVAPENNVQNRNLEADLLRPANTYNYRLKYESKNIPLNSDYKEITEILERTPYLWRQPVPSRKISTRIEDQDFWIQRISKTNFIKNSKPKRILVKDSIKLYYGTQGRLRCPYAPEFEDRCIVIRNPYIKYLRSGFGSSPPIIDPELINFIIKHEIDAVTQVVKYQAPRWSKVEEPLLPKNVTEVLYIWEPSHIAKTVDLGKNKVILASHSSVSDIPVPYRRWIKHNGSPQTTFRRSGNIDELLKSKKKMVTAMISNCNRTRNNRMEFISELQKYVEVDVYGKCGNNSCPKPTRYFDCMKKLEKDYRFYLAFENSNCEDYITEKFFDNGLKYSMVPIVMGAHPATYTMDGPEHSFIHVDDFESPKALAKYLIKLSKNDDQYKKYFKYKGTGQVTNEGHETFFCKLCGMLYYSDFVPVPSYEAGTSWKDVNYCLPQGQYYWNKSFT